LFFNLYWVFLRRWQTMNQHIWAWTPPQPRKPWTQVPQSTHPHPDDTTFNWKYFQRISFSSRIIYLLSFFFSLHLPVFFISPSTSIIIMSTPDNESHSKSHSKCFFFFFKVKILIRCNLIMTFLQVVFDQHLDSHLVSTKTFNRNFFKFSFIDHFF